MSTWLPRIRVAFPVELIDTANRLAQLTDPDVGGALTFDAERTVEINGEPYIYADIPFMAHFWPIVESRDPAVWFQAMGQLAVEKSLEPLSEAEIVELCAGCLLGDECADTTTPEGVQNG